MCLSERVWLRLTAIYIKRKGFQIWQGTHTKMLMHVAMEILKGHNTRPEIQGTEINKEKAVK